MVKTDWEKQASNLLKAELTRRGIGYEALRVALAEIGIEKTAANINKTINGGKFSFAFFLQCSKAVGLEKVILV
jgi:hypothetical protein